MLGAMRRPASLEDLELPNVDIAEDNENFYIISELPGMTEGDVKVTIGHDLLTISGHHVKKEVTKPRHYHNRERIEHDFVRSFTIPDTVKAPAISGTFRDGLLELTLPKEKPDSVPIREVPLTMIARSGNNSSILRAH